MVTSCLWKKYIVFDKAKILKQKSVQVTEICLLVQECTFCSHATVCVCVRLECVSGKCRPKPSPFFK